MKKTLFAAAMTVLVVSVLQTAGATISDPTIREAGQLMVHPGHQCQTTGTYIPRTGPNGNIVLTTVGWGGTPDIGTTIAVIINKQWFGYPYTLKLCLNQPAISNPNGDQPGGEAGVNINYVIIGTPTP